MRNRFDMQLQDLNNELIEMGNLIEKAIQMSVMALVKQDVNEAKKVMDFDDEVDEKEKQIENLCLRLLLQQQPVAKDLRLISSALKMITDMERIGDQAADIAELTIILSDKPYIKNMEHIQLMAKEAALMVNSSIEAFVERNLEIADKVIKQDDLIDELFLKVKNELVELIRENSQNSDQAADLLMVAKYFERIGDHATNIAEWVIFSITGKHNDEE